MSDFQNIILNLWKKEKQKKKIRATMYHNTEQSM